MIAEINRTIQKCFFCIPMQGCSDIDSDYSQIHFTHGFNIPGFSLTI